MFLGYIWRKLTLAPLISEGAIWSKCYHCGSEKGLVRYHLSHAAGQCLWCGKRLEFFRTLTGWKPNIKVEIPCPVCQLSAKEYVAGYACSKCGFTIYDPLLKCANGHHFPNEWEQRQQNFNQSHTCVGKLKMTQSVE